MKPHASSAAALLCAALTAPAQAYTLDFGNTANAPLVACSTASGVCSTFSRLLQSYGDVAGVVDVTTHAWDGGALTWWNDNYNDLYGVVFNNAFSAAAPAWVDLVPLAAGSAVNLSHFDLGGYLGKRNNVAVDVFDLGSGEALFSYLGSVGTQAGNGHWGQHTGFDLALSSYSGLRIQWADPSVAGNTAIDNISFTVGAPVPEPTSGALLLCGLASLGWLARRRRGMVAGMSLALLGAGAAQAAPAQYSLQVLPRLPAAQTSPWVEGLNNHGAVVGRSDIGSDVLATLWVPGMPARDLGGLPATQRWAMAYGINDSGTVVGDAASGSTGVHAFRWTADGGMQDLSASIGGLNSRAFGINNAGQAVGSAYLNTGIEAGLWQADGAYTSVGHASRAGDFALMSHAYAISDSGYVLGSTYFNSGVNGVFRWDAQQGKLALPDLAEGSGRYQPAGINEQGWAVGTSWVGDSSDDARALLWNPAGQVLALQGGGFVSSTALGINGSGTVVGRAWRSDGANSFVWTQDSGMLDLRSLVLDLGSFSLGGASAINEAGQIAGWGYDMLSGQAHAYLLTPVPEPMPLLLWAAGLALLGLRRWQGVRAT